MAPIVSYVLTLALLLLPLSLPHLIHERNHLSLEDYLLNKITWLDNLGRVSRSKKNTKYENFLTDLQRLTLVHEGNNSDGSGGEYFRFATSNSASPKATGGDDPKEKKGNDKDKKKPKADKKNSSKAVPSGSGDQSKTDTKQNGGSQGAGEKNGTNDEDGENLSDDRTVAE